MKLTINQDERQLLLLRTRALSMLATKSQVEFSTGGDISTCAILFKQLVEFDSPRVMIQEVQSSSQVLQKTEMIHQDTDHHI